MRAYEPASALRRPAKYIAVVAQPLIQLRMQQEAVDADACRIEIRPCARCHSDPRRVAITWHTLGTIRRQFLRPHTAACRSAADSHAGDEAIQSCVMLPACHGA